MNSGWKEIYSNLKDRKLPLLRDLDGAERLELLYDIKADIYEIYDGLGLSGVTISEQSAKKLDNLLDNIQGQIEDLSPSYDRYLDERIEFYVYT